MGAGWHPAFPAPSDRRGLTTAAKLGPIVPRERSRTSSCCLTCESNDREIIPMSRTRRRRFFSASSRTKQAKLSYGAGRDGMPSAFAKASARQVDKPAAGGNLLCMGLFSMFWQHAFSQHAPVSTSPDNALVLAMQAMSRIAAIAGTKTRAASVRIPVKKSLSAARCSQHCACMRRMQNGAVSYHRQCANHAVRHACDSRKRSAPLTNCRTITVGTTPREAHASHTWD